MIKTVNELLLGDVRIIAPALPDQSVNCIVTSPPYWGLRDYGVAGQIGLESTPEEYVQTMVEIFRELRRVLRDDGTLWLVLGDSYTSMLRSGRAESPGVGAKQKMKKVKTSLKWHAGDGSKFRWTLPGGQKPKDLVGIPWMVAFALRSDGWWLRSDIIWAKTNPMPESVKDRPTKAHEHIFLLAKSERYYYDADIIREPLAEASQGRMERKQRLIDREGVGTLGKQVRAGVDQSHGYAGLALARGGKTGYNPAGRNKRTVWTVATYPYPKAHFATFPPDLIRPCILAGCPPGGLVLDPFMGSGTVAQVCLETGRNWLGIELNPEYAELTKKRIEAQQSKVEP